jgi:parallel beta-helix repeat protein
MGININSSSFDNIVNNTISIPESGSYGIYIHSSSNYSTFLYNSVINTGSNGAGVYMSSSYNNDFEGNTFASTTGSYGYGVHLTDSSQSNTFTNNTISEYSFNYGDFYSAGGVTLEIDSSNNTLADNIISASGTSNHAVSVVNSQDNRIYNNVINSTTPVYLSSAGTNYWNTTIQSGTSIIGSPYIGGNFYATPTETGFSESCSDENRNWICDSNYTINSSNIDYLPLAEYVLQCGDTITGDAVLTFDLDGCTGNGINVGADDVTLDCAGNSINGSNSDYGIYVNGSNNITLKNCTVSYFGNGIRIESSSNNNLINVVATNNGYLAASAYDGIVFSNSSNNSLINVTASDNLNVGIIFNVGSNNNLTSITVSNNGEHGISATASPNNIMIDVTVDNNGYGGTCPQCQTYGGIDIDEDSDNSIVTNSIFTNNYAGIYISEADNNNITNNTVNNNNAGIFIQLSEGNIITNNTANNNIEGVYLYSSTDNTLFNNTANNNSDDGFYLYVSDNNNLTNNTANDNLIGIQLRIPCNNNNLINNTVNYNDDKGILIEPSENNVLTGNTVNNNPYGLYIDDSPSTLIWHNNIYDNSLNIYSNNAIELSNGAEGNYWGHSTCPIFAAGADSNDVSVIDSYAYSAADGWLTSQPAICTCDTTITTSTTLTTDLTGCSGNGLIIGADDVILDCAGYSITGSGFSNGVYLEGRANITIINCTISNFEYGINLNFSNISMITNNTINSNMAGVFITGSSNTIDSNMITENFAFDLFTQDMCDSIVTNNTGSGERPILYYNDSVNLQDQTVSELILCNADNSNITNVTIEGSASLQNNGFVVFLTDWSNFTNVNSSNNLMGIVIVQSFNNTLALSTFNSNGQNGIYFYNSSNNSITNSTSLSNGDSGLSIEESYDNIVNYNSFYNNTNNELYLSGSGDFTLNYWGDYLCNVKITGIVLDNLLPFYTDSDLTTLDSSPLVCVCGTTITEDKTLAHDYICTGDGITIGADDITLDCNGHYITGAGSNNGISLGNNNVTVKNCTISDFTNGFNLLGANNATIKYNTIHDVTSVGINGYSGAEWVEISHNEIYNAVEGIHLDNDYDGDIIEYNNIHSVSDHGIYLYYITNAHVDNNYIESDSADGISVSYITKSVFAGNTIVGGNLGIEMTNSYNNTLQNNNISDTAYHGIYVDGGGSDSNHTITDNNVTNACDSGGNSCGGIYLYQVVNCLIQGNNVSESNGHGILLVTSYDNRILLNNVSNNGWAGITITSPVSAELGGYNNVSWNTLTNNKIGIATKTQNNSFIDNTISTEGEGTYLYGIDLRRTGGVYPENNYLSGNDVSGYQYGFNAWSGIESFTIDGDSYHNNDYGIYLWGVGSEELMPTILNTEIYDNSEGMHLQSSIASITNTSFNGNSGGADTGLYVDSSSKAYLTNGNFENNGNYAINDQNGPLFVYWNITGDAVCTNNSVSMWGVINFLGGSLELNNCTLTINNSIVEREGNITILSIVHEDVVANQSEEFAFEDVDSNITLSLAEDVTVTISIVPETPNSTPSSGLITLKGIDIEVDSSTSGNLTWALIKIFYNESELTEAGIDESTLKIYFYNATSSGWQLEPNQGVDIVNNYVWANVTHFSLFGVFGSVEVPVTPVPPGAVLSVISGGGCMPKWNCSDWSVCSTNGTKTRKCTDLNRCGISLNKPNETTTCVYASAEINPCEENWNCTEWSGCVNAGKNRVCTDLNACGTALNKPTEVEYCVEKAEVEAPTRNLDVIIVPAIAVLLVVVALMAIKRGRKQIMLNKT